MYHLDLVERSHDNYLLTRYNKSGKTKINACLSGQNRYFFTLSKASLIILNNNILISNQKLNFYLNSTQAVKVWDFFVKKFLD